MVFWVIAACLGIAGPDEIRWAAAAPLWKLHGPSGAVIGVEPGPVWAPAARVPGTAAVLGRPHS